MKKIIDENGLIVKGFYRDKNGSILVDNKPEYTKYIQQREHALGQKGIISDLKNEINELKELVLSLINKNRS